MGMLGVGKNSSMQIRGSSRVCIGRERIATFPARRIRGKSRRECERAEPPTYRENHRVLRCAFRSADRRTRFLDARAHAHVHLPGTIIVGHSINDGTLDRKLQIELSVLQERDALSCESRSYLSSLLLAEGGKP